MKYYIISFNLLRDVYSEEKNYVRAFEKTFAATDCEIETLKDFLKLRHLLFLKKRKIVSSLVGQKKFFSGF